MSQFGHAHELTDLYQEVIIEHSKHPRNFKKLDNATHTAEGFNPLCGDQITIYAAVSENQISEIGFLGDGCAISKASASLMTSAVKGKSFAEAISLFESFRSLLIGGENAKSEKEKLGKLAALSGVSEFPMRVKCATLAWHTLKNALEQKGAASTEE
ncbi:MAG: Fe-S cluster assembly sulfur transfer protein SufU [Nitrospirota bacterium]|mgnify:CR=1 FL=1